MKKIFLLVFSLVLSFSSYGEIELDFSSDTFCINSPKTQVRNKQYYLPNTVQPYSGENICIYSSNGQYYNQGEIKNGFKYGDWQWWFENGEISEKRYFNYNDKKRQDWITWREEGQKHYEGSMYDGNGVSNTYYRNGQQQVKWKYKDGELVEKILWHENGQKKLEEYYIDGKKDGKWTEWNENGQIVLETIYTEGEQLAQSQQNKDLLELEIAELKEAEAEILYRQLLAKEVQDEQDTARSLIIEDQLNTLQNAYINNIAARIKTFWRYQSAESHWTAEVYVVQDRDGNVRAVDVKNANVGNSKLAKSFMDSIERAVNKASPLPGAPDEAVFDKELYFIFSVN